MLKRGPRCKAAQQLTTKPGKMICDDGKRWWSTTRRKGEARISKYHVQTDLFCLFTQSKPEIFLSLLKPEKYKRLLLSFKNTNIGIFNAKEQQCITLYLLLIVQAFIPKINQQAQRFGYWVHLYTCGQSKWFWHLIYMVPVLCYSENWVGLTEPALTEPALKHIWKKGNI